MAYFGGTVSQRPWPHLDAGFVILFAMSLAGIGVSIYFGYDLLRRQLVQQVGSAAVQPEAVRAPAAPAAIETAMTKVVVATDNIPAGRRLQPTLFRLESMDAANLQPGIVTRLEDLNGKYSRGEIKAGLPLAADSIGLPEIQNDIIPQIPPGYRAVAIPVNVLTGVEGWVRPGAHVDVVWSTTQNGRLVASTLVENATVISVARSLEARMNDEADPQTMPQHISLLVSTRDAQKVQLAKNTGSISLSLRGQDDTVRAGTGTLSTDSLLKSGPGNVPSNIGRVVVDGREFYLREGQLIPGDEYRRKLQQAKQD